MSGHGPQTTEVVSSFLSRFFGVKKANDATHVFVSSEDSPSTRCLDIIPFSALEMERNETDVIFTGNLELVSAQYRDSVNIAFGIGHKKRVRRGATRRFRPPSKKLPSVRTRKLGGRKRKRNTNVTCAVKTSTFVSLMEDWMNGIQPRQSIEQTVSWEYSESTRSLLVRLKKLGARVVENKFQLTSL